MDIKERLDRVKEIIQSEDFLEGKGLSNEVNFWMFCYDAKEEMIVRHFIEQITKENLKCHIVYYDLYEVFLKICEDNRILNRIPQLEEKRGKDFLAKQFSKMCDAKTFAQKMDFEPQKGDVILLGGVGKVFPFMRVHSLLEALQTHFTKTPVVTLYPGTFDGHQVKLFNLLKPNEYYRAFNML